MSLGKLTKPGGVHTILGVDASTNSFAFCLFDGKPIRWGEFTFSGSNVYERLADAQVKAMGMKPHLRADLICFEGAVYVQNKSTVILLAMALGAMIPPLVDKGSRIETISPITWQNAIGNKSLTKVEKQKIIDSTPGKSKTWYTAANRDFRKQRTMDWVYTTYGINVESDNVSDAIALSHVALAKFAS